LLNFNDNCGNGLNELSISPFLPLAQPFLQGIQHLKETMIFPENLLPVISPGNHMVEIPTPDLHLSYLSFTG
jgi:hypothetical protein